MAPPSPEACRESQLPSRLATRRLACVAMDPEELSGSVIVIADEFSSMSDEEYADALAAWLAKADSLEPLVLPVSATETLREIRQSGES